MVDNRAKQSSTSMSSVVDDVSMFESLRLKMRLRTNQKQSGGRSGLISSLIVVAQTHSIDSLSRQSASVCT